jgi:GH24 family phage-related lysozyme (muramidase)
MLISKKCVDFVKSFEGFSSTKYLDSVGVKTLGYGMTGNTIANLNYVTEQQASSMLENLLNNNFAAPIKADLDRKGITLNQGQFDALVSMAYNIGVGGLLSSTLYKNIVAGVRDKATITSNFQAWSKAGGQIVQGLYRRRTEEAELFFSDNSVYVDVCYNAYIQNIGWQGGVVNGAVAGTAGQGLRMEAIQIASAVPLAYKVYVQNTGWMPEVKNGQTAGTIDKALRIEAIAIRSLDSKYSVQYQAQVQNIGWQDWASDGTGSGTTGKSLRLEAIRIRIIKK